MIAYVFIMALVVWTTLRSRSEYAFVRRVCIGTLCLQGFVLILSDIFRINFFQSNSFIIILTLLFTMLISVSIYYIVRDMQSQKNT